MPTGTDHEESTRAGKEGKNQGRIRISFFVNRGLHDRCKAHGIPLAYFAEQGLLQELVRREEEHAKWRASNPGPWNDCPGGGCKD